MPSDYYIVLGVEQGASLSQIKKAYRNAIKRYHPDRIGKNTDSRKFRAAREAYEVLSDAEKRRAYDAERHRQDNPSPKKYHSEATKQNHRTWKTFRTPPIRDRLHEKMIPGFGRNRRLRPARAQDLYLEVILTETEALHGGIFPLSIPVATPCSYCGKRGWSEDLGCPACLGYGVVRSRRQFNLSLPPGLPDGTTFKVSFEAGGQDEVGLFIAVRVGGHTYR